MYVSLHVMSDFAESMQAIPISKAVIPSLELVEESPIRPSEDYKSG